MAGVALEDHERERPVLRGGEGRSTLAETGGDPQRLGGSRSVRQVPVPLRGRRTPPDHEAPRDGIVRLVHDQPPRGEVAERRIHLPVPQPRRHPKQFPDVHRVGEAVGPREVAGQHPGPHLAVETDQRAAGRLGAGPVGTAAAAGGEHRRRTREQRPDPPPPGARAPHRAEDSPPPTMAGPPFSVGEKEAGQVRLSTVVLSLAIPFAGLAAPSSSQPRNGPESLAALYELGGAVADENGDGVADRLRARLVLADAPSAGEVAAAAEIAARLGLETMALDLPLPDAAPLAITVGDEALRGAGVSGIAELAPGRGAVELHSVGGTTVVGVRGGSPAGLSAAARWLASRAPRVFLTGGETLSEVEAAVLEATGEAATGVRTVRVEMEAGASALALAEVRVAAGDAGAAAGIASAVEAAGDDLRFDSLAALRVVATHPGGETPASVGHDPPAPEPGPVPARPGTGPKTDLGLGAFYEPDGILGDSNGDRIPDRLDSRLVLTAEDPAGALALAARLGLESSAWTSRWRQRPARWPNRRSCPPRC